MEWTPDVCWDAVITEGTISSDKFTVTIQLKDYAGNNLTVPASIIAYLSDGSDGADIVTLSQDVSKTSSGDGDVAILTSDEVWLLTSEADGSISLDVETTGSHTYYLVLVMPNGKLSISDVLTFT